MGENHFVALKNKISECRKIEENLWSLLNSDKRGKLKDAHAQLKLLVSEITKEISSVDAEQKYFSGVNTGIAKEFQKRLLLLEQLLVKQHSELVDIESLSHDDIVKILNADKQGKDISQTSQHIQDIEKGIDDLSSKYIVPTVPNLISNLEVEEPPGIYSRNYWRYEDSLKKLRDRGFKRHLRPVEFFNVLVENEKVGVLPLAESTVPLAHWQSGCDEWISLALKKEGDALQIAFDPENLAWNSSLRKYIVLDGRLKHAGKLSGFPYNLIADFYDQNKNAYIFNIKNTGTDLIRGGTPISQFPVVLMKALAGAEPSDISRYRIAVYLPPEGEWEPATVGFNSGFDFLFIDANGNETAYSRGVR